MNSNLDNGILIIPNGTKIINKSQYAGRTDIERVIIPEGVLEIDDEAFIFCEGLTSVSLPSTLKRIGNSAFQDCVNLEKISLPNGILELGHACFCNCISLKNVAVPRGTKALDLAFYKTKVAYEINLRLREVQEKWYRMLLKKYPKYRCKNPSIDSFSSPFCCGISQKEYALDKDMIMYVGEEARGWYFDKCANDIEYLQDYGVSYFEGQIYGNTSDEIKANPSKFWNYLKGIRAEKYSVCWNNLDKIHRINKERKTLALTIAMENELYDISINGKSLLLNEINIVKPKFVIFTKYIHSTAKALGIDENELWKIKKAHMALGECVADISNLCKENNIFARKDTVALLLLNHPNCRKNGFLQRAIKETLKKIQSAE